jgi:homocitrate synthase
MPFDHYSIIESTLREGEQFSTATFDTAQKLEIAGALDNFGVEMIEMTSPCASPQSEADIRTVVNAGLNARILTHIRCHKGDAIRALDTGVAGLDIVIGTSPQLMRHSHGKDIRQIIDLAEDVLSFVREQAPDIVLRFSTEDTFRSSESDLLRVYLAVAQMGYVNRLGVADTVGVALPTQVYNMVHQLVRLTGLDVEFHGHNDSGCAIANACAALEAGATHIDTTVLGIDIPFNNYITGSSAFIHKAGIHAKAVLADPTTYEILQPDDFGLTREVAIGHRLTGWNAIRDRSRTLGLSLDDDTIKTITLDVKRRADARPLALAEIDVLLRAAAGD